MEDNKDKKNNLILQSKHLQTVTKEQMLAHIYEVIANKELSFGCRVNLVWHKDWEFIFLNNYGKTHPNMLPTFYWYYWIEKGEEVAKVIWCPVMIWDTFERFRQEEVRDKLVKQFDDIYNLYIGVMKMRKDKRKPIDEQSEDCIRLIYWFVN